MQSYRIVVNIARVSAELILCPLRALLIAFLNCWLFVKQLAALGTCLIALLNFLLASKAVLITASFQASLTKLPIALAALPAQPIALLPKFLEKFAVCFTVFLNLLRALLPTLLAAFLGLALLAFLATLRPTFLMLLPIPPRFLLPRFFFLLALVMVLPSVSSYAETASSKESNSGSAGTRVITVSPPGLQTALAESAQDSAVSASYS